MRTVALLVFISTVLAAGAWLLFLWAVKSDQYDDVEGPKHRMMDDDSPGTARPAIATPRAGPRLSPKDKTARPE